jgi:hypothetical protein
MRIRWNTRLVWLGLLLTLVVPPVFGAAPAPLDPGLARTRPGDPTLWFSVESLGLEGRGWKDTLSAYDRLPARAQGKVTDAVWGLSRQSAGLAVRFGTDARTIKARWALTSGNLAMPHMPATGVSGLDLYVREAKGSWRWLAVGQAKSQTNEVALISGLPPGWREYLLYLPLYNGVSSVELGVPPENTLAPGSPWGEGARKPVVFYGTSITQGGCASRPGMVHVAILGRRLQWPTINLGFSGSGRMEPAMAELLSELDPSVFVLDCLPNMKADEVTQRLAPFVRRLREARPSTPIVLVEDRYYTDGFLVEARRRHNEANHGALRAAYDSLRRDGIRNLHYLPADQLLGADGEGTVDASHPTDLGFLRHADAMERVLKPLLRKASR